MSNYFVILSGIFTKDVFSCSFNEIGGERELENMFSVLKLYFLCGLHFLYEESQKSREKRVLNMVPIL